MTSIYKYCVITVLKYSELKHDLFGSPTYYLYRRALFLPNQEYESNSTILFVIVLFVLQSLSEVKLAWFGRRRFQTVLSIL